MVRDSVSEVPDVGDAYKRIALTLKELAKAILTTSINLNSEVLQRTQEIERKHKSVFDVLLKELNGQVVENESNCKKAADLRDLYYQMSSNCEQSTANMNKLVDEFAGQLISQEQLETENRKYTDLKIYAQEKKVEYEAAIGVANQSWKKHLTSLAQFFQTMNAVDKDRQIVVIATASALHGLVDPLVKTVSTQRREIRNAVEKSFAGSQKITFVSVQNRVERLARMALNLPKTASIEFTFTPYEVAKAEGGWRPKSSLLEKSFEADLTDKDRANLSLIVDDLFNSQVMQSRLKLTDAEINNLFSKEAAVVEFLVKSQRILSTEDFWYAMNESKYNILAKVMRRVIERLISRNERIGELQRGEIREDYGAH